MALMNSLRYFHSQNPILAKLVVEFVGTFFSSWVVIMGSNLDFPGVVVTVPSALAAALTYWIALSIGAKISGGHFNPFVSFSRLILHRMKIIHFIAYFFVQMTAGFIAAYSAYGYYKSANHTIPFGLSEEVDHKEIAKVWGLFGIYAIVFFFVWNTVMDPNFSKKSDPILKYAVVSGALYFGIDGSVYRGEGILIGTPMFNGAFNLAIGLPAWCASYTESTTGIQTDQLYWLCFSPLFGCLVGSALYALFPKAALSSRLVDNDEFTDPLK
mmetsp:Transcript_48039/g.55351  ORF Transcript_48039/g.55351 Transcript_48039/m.55351 type:complete len:270 (-) Transcript_48039:136-945(-)